VILALHARVNLHAVAAACQLTKRWHFFNPWSTISLLDRIKFYGSKDNRYRLRSGRGNESIDADYLCIKVSS
jgi:hypothetical protein